MRPATLALVARRGLPLLVAVALAAGAVAFTAVAARPGEESIVEGETAGAPAAVDTLPAPRRAPARAEAVVAPEAGAPGGARRAPRVADAGRPAAAPAAARASRPAAPAAAPAPPAVEPPAPATPAAAPPSPAGESLAGVGARLLLGALLLAGLLYGAARAMRRLPIARLLPGADGPIKVIGRAHLGPRGSLCLVEVEGTTLLVGVTASAIQTLHAWSRSADAAAAPARAAAVPGQLRNLESRLTGRNG